MNILKFGHFIHESKDADHLLYYAFDWDDNILNMPTVIHMEKKEGETWIPVDVSTAKFAIVRNDLENYRISNDAFCEFRDSGPRGDDAFLIDVKDAILQNRLGPAWGDFIECLTHGSIFAIITARGHESPAMRKGIEYIIDYILTPGQQEQMYNYLLKYAYMYREDEGHDRMLKGKPSQNSLVKKYLDICDLVGVSAPSRGGSPASPEKSKEEALMQFKDKVNKFAESIGIDAKIGFSDDDVKNVKHIEDLVDNLSKERFPSIIEFVIKNTKNPEGVTKKVRTMTEGTNQGTGLESSVLPFTQFNNMTSKLYPSDKDTRQDDYLNQSKRQVNYLAKNSKEFSEDFKKRRHERMSKIKKPSK